MIKRTRPHVCMLYGPEDIYYNKDFRAIKKQKY
jgi:hypothetical protein